MIKQGNSYDTHVSAWCVSGLGCGLAVLAVGSYRLCDGCVSPTRQIIQEDVANEEGRLLEPGHLQKSYTIETQTVIPARCCTRCRISSSITVAGALIAVGSVVAGILVYTGKIAAESELANLQEFKIPNPDIKPMK